MANMRVDTEMPSPRFWSLDRMAAMGMNAGDQYHGRPAMTNQDAALAGMVEMQRRGQWNTGGPPSKPALTPEEMRVKRLWRTIRVVVFGILAIAFAWGGYGDLQTGNYSPVGSFLIAGVFAFGALHQIDRLRASRGPDQSLKA
jgi:hypothetical protein